MKELRRIIHKQKSIIESLTARYNELKDSSDDIVLQNAICESEVEYELNEEKPYPEKDWHVLIKTAPIFDQINSLVSKKSKIDILNETKSDEFHCLMERSKLQCTQAGFKMIPTERLNVINVVLLKLTVLTTESQSI